VAARHEFELDNGSKFYIRRYEPFLSLTILGEVQRKFLPPMASLMEANDQKNTDEERTKSAMQAMETISKNLDGKSLVDLTKLVLNREYISVSIQGDAPRQLDEGAINLACEDVSEVIELVLEVLRFNYERLFTQGRNLIGRASPQVANQ
jgi:hypothetical protein